MPSGQIIEQYNLPNTRVRTISATMTPTLRASNAGINCTFSQVYDKKQPKVEVLKEIGTELHFDDSPNVVGDCLREGVNIAMISNDTTLYNHYLRNRVQHYTDLKTALIKTGIIGR